MGDPSIAGGGTAERRREANSTALYRRVIAGQTEGLQLLCANCNIIKRVVQKESVGARVYTRTFRTVRWQDNPVAVTETVNY